MGMWDKDKEYGLNMTDEFPAREPFILWGVEDAGEVEANPQLPPARKTRLNVSRLSTPAAKFIVTTLGSAIADKIAGASRDDFPAICYWTIVASKNYGNDATVLQFVREPTQAELAGTRQEPLPERVARSDNRDDTPPF